MTESGGMVRRLRRVLVAIVVLVLWGLLTHGTFAGSGDEPHYLAIAHSIAFDGDLDLANNYGANEPWIGGGVLQPEAHVRPGAGGVARPVHDIGLPLLFAPVVRVAVPVTRALAGMVPASALARARLTPGLLYRHVLSLAMSLLAAVLAALLFDTFIAMGGSPGAAFGSALLLALSPPLLIFAILFFTELLSALLCLFAFRRIVLLTTTGPLAWALVGAATGLLFLVHARNIGLVVPLVGLAVLTLRTSAPPRDAGGFALGLIALLAIRTGINHHFWGTWLTGPHAKIGTSLNVVAGLRETGVRLAGLLVDQEFGLIPYAPIYLLAIAGMIALTRTHRHLAWPILAVVGGYVLLIVLPVTNVHGWTGGWSPAARFLTPIVPLLGIAVFAGLRATFRPIVIALVAIQIAIDGYAWQHPKILWNEGDGRAAICDRLGEPVCRALPSLVRAP